MNYSFLKMAKVESASFVELIDEAVDFMINTPVEALPPEERFSGGGVYALYYKGKFPQYKKIFEEDSNSTLAIFKKL